MNSSYYKCPIIIEVWSVLDRLLVELAGCSFLFNSFRRTNMFSPIKNSFPSFFLLAEYHFLSYLSSLAWSFCVFSILYILKSILNCLLVKNSFSISSGNKPYFMLLRRFMFRLEFCIIMVGLICNFWAFRFYILVLRSCIFYSAANALPPLTKEVSISTLFS